MAGALNTLHGMSNPAAALTSNFSELMHADAFGYDFVIADGAGTGWITLPVGVISVTAANGVATFTMRNGNAATIGVAELDLYFAGRFDDRHMRQRIWQNARWRDAYLEGARRAGIYRHSGAVCACGRDSLSGNRKIMS